MNEIINVPIRQALHKAATRYVTKSDPIWYDVGDLVNDLLAKFLFEAGVYSPIEESESLSEASEAR